MNNDISYLLKKVRLCSILLVVCRAVSKVIAMHNAASFTRRKLKWKFRSFFCDSKVLSGPGRHQTLRIEAGIVSPTQLLVFILMVAVPSVPRRSPLLFWLLNIATASQDCLHIALEAPTRHSSLMPHHLAALSPRLAVSHPPAWLPTHPSKVQTYLKAHLVWLLAVSQREAR